MRAWVLLLSLSCVTLSFAAAPPAKVPPEVLRWIDQLGDEDVGKRKAAQKKLEALGEDVVPTLRRAAKSHEDVDVRLRAVVLAAAIEKSLVPLVRSFAGHPNGGAWFAAASPDGKRIASSGADRVVRLHDAATGKALKTFEGHTDTVHALAFSDDGKRLLTGGHDRSVRLWDVASGKEIQRFTDHTEVVTCAAFVDDRHAVTSSYDKTLRLWKLRR